MVELCVRSHHRQITSESDEDSARGRQGGGQTTRRTPGYACRLQPRKVGPREAGVARLRAVDGEPRDFSKQRGLDAPRFDAERGRQMKVTHLDVIANAHDRVGASYEANDAVRNSRQLNHTFDFACHVLEHLAARLTTMPESAPLSMLERASCRLRRDGVSSVRFFFQARSDAQRVHRSHTSR